MSEQMSRREIQSRKKRKRRKMGCITKTLLILVLFALVGVGGYAAYLYNRASSVVNNVQNKEIASQVEDKRVEDVKPGTDPISILLMGIDTGTYGRGNEGGRSDILILLTVNPKTKQAKMVSIPRDTYAEIVGHGTEDKINHAYAFGGAAMTVNSVQKLFDIPVDYFVTIDMGGFIEVIDALGGIEVTPSETFEQEGFFFTEGETQVMNGETALQYVRSRFTDKGDYGRQQRSREVIEALAKKGVSLTSVANLSELLDIVEKYVTTNFAFKDIQKLSADMLQIAKNIEIITLQSSGEMIDGIYYEMLDQDSLKNIQQQLKDNLEVD